MFPVVRPSVRPKLEIPLLHLYMGPLVRPTNSDRFSASPPVRPDWFPGISRRTHGENSLNFVCWCIANTFRTGLIMVPVCWFSSFWCYFYLMKWVLLVVSVHFPENTWREWPEILHADVYWPLPALLDYNQGLMIFLILALFWLSETGQICGSRAIPGKFMEGMAWNFACWCLLTTFRTHHISVVVCWFFLIMVPLWFSETGHIWGLLASSRECLGVNDEGGGGAEAYFRRFFVELCLVWNIVFKNCWFVNWT